MAEERVSKGARVDARVSPPNIHRCRIRNHYPLITPPPPPPPSRRIPRRQPFPAQVPVPASPSNALGGKAQGAAPQAPVDAVDYPHERPAAGAVFRLGAGRREQVALDGGKSEGGKRGQPQFLLSLELVEPGLFFPFKYFAVTIYLINHRC
jgi:hypothetical protein